LKLYCPNCFYPNEVNQRLCERCKKPLEWKEENFEAKLIKALSHGEPETALRVATILSNFKSSKVERALIKSILNSKDPYFQAAGLNSLALVGSRKSLSVFRRMALNGFLLPRLKAIEGIAKIGSLGDIRFLEKLMNDSNESIRNRTKDAIRTIRDKYSVLAKN